MSLFKVLFGNQKSLVETFTRKDLKLRELSSGVYFGLDKDNRIYIILTLDPEIYLEIEKNTFARFASKFPHMDEGESLILQTVQGIKLVVRRKKENSVHVYFCAGGHAGNGYVDFDKFVSGIEAVMVRVFPPPNLKPAE